VIEGSVPDPARKPQGCPFHPRCPLAKPICSKEMPGRHAAAEGHMVRCWAVEEAA